MRSGATAFLPLAAILLAASPARAEEPAPATPPAPAPSQPGRAPLRFILGLTADFGFEKLATVTFSDGSTSSIHVNDGLGLAAGLAVPNTADRLLETQAMIGVKFKTISASNGDVTWLSFPIEILEFVHVQWFRAGAGLAVHLGPKISASGFAAGLDTSFSTGIGAVAQVGYEHAFATLRQGVPVLFFIDARYTWLKLSAGGGSIDGSGLGFATGVAF